MKSVADPGFPRGGGANSPGVHQHRYLPNFPKNCMKLKEFGPPEGGGRMSLVPSLRSATVKEFHLFQKTISTSVCVENVDVICVTSIVQLDELIVSRIGNSRD